MTSTAIPIDWLRSLGSALDNFCTIQSKNLIEKRKRDLSNQQTAKKAPSTVRKTKTTTGPQIEQSAQKILNHRRKSSNFDLSTPLKAKDKSPSTCVIELPVEQTPSHSRIEPSPLSLTLETPTIKPLINETPFTESRVKRTAATKANKYIDIVTRRLAEVPANGSTPKSMKIASKLILDKSPKSRSQILLSSVTQKTALASESQNIHIPTVQASTSISNTIPSTPATVRKRNRTAKIHEIFNTSLMSLASAATADEKVNFKAPRIASSPKAGHILSPSNVTVAPSTISKSSKLNQMTNEENDLKVNTTSEIAVNIVSPVKRSTRVSPTKKTKSQKVSPARKTTPKVSPVKKTPKASPLKKNILTDNINIKVTVPSVPVLMTPKVQNPSLKVEFVAPSSVLRTSKRPRKQIDCSDVINSTPAQKKVQLNFIDVPVPVVSVNNNSYIKISSTASDISETIPSNALPSVIQNSNRISISSAAVPSIIVPTTGNSKDQSETSSNDDLYGINSKKTPLRVQPMRTPTRSKAIIPSLSDYSAATKIAVIEVAKNSQIMNQQNKPATPKVEPWTTRFMQKDQQQPPAIKPAMTQFMVKPIDTSKISGYQANSTISASISANQAPIVPKFPLNLANISNMTNRSITVPLLPQPSVVVPESPLTRAKRLDSENTAREEKLKNGATSKVEKIKLAIGDLRSSGGDEQNETETETISTTQIPPNPLPSNSTIKITADVVVNTANTSNSSSILASMSKLPVKPKPTILPSPKVPSRLAEAFSGIDSELPPIDIGLADDEKILRDILSGEKSSVPTKEKEKDNERILKPVAAVSSAAKTAITTASMTLGLNATPSTQLHRTAVMNSAAARKANPLTVDTTVIQKTAMTSKPTQTIVTTIPVVPTTPAPNSSPVLPEIHSDEDDEIDKQKNLTERENRPTWAMTPNLTVALNAQRSKRAEDVFGKVQPIKLEDFFKGSGKKFPNRSSTSNWNNNI